MEELDLKFNSLNNNLCMLGILEGAWENVSSNNGIIGINKQIIDDIRAYMID